MKELFPTKTKIIRPYSLRNNVSLFLKNGWGVYPSRSTADRFKQYNQRSELRRFNIVLTNEVFQIDHDDTAEIGIIEKQLTDFETIKDCFLGVDQIGIDGNVQKIDFVGQSGVEFITIDTFNCIVGELTLSFSITEAVNGC